MGNQTTLLQFCNNEKLALKQRLERKNLEKNPIKHGILILEQLISEIDDLGEKAVLEKYSN